MAYAVAGCSACLVLCGLIVAIASLGSVKQNEYGLLLNWVTKEIKPQVFHGGRHFIGPWNGFITFPATVQTVEFSERHDRRTAEPLHTRTKEGLGLQLSISFQYKLKSAEIPQLYALTNSAYEGLFTRIARDQLLEAAAKYNGPQYWQERDKISDEMRDLVKASLDASHCTLWNLQLLDINLPATYEDSITKTQVQNQLIRTRESQQRAASVRADTEVLNSTYHRDISVVQAGANANFTLKTKEAQALAASRKIDAEAEALEYARNAMEFSAEDAVSYAALSAYSQLENATILANINGPMPALKLRGSGSNI